ncbi:MAG TPA: MFS transporter [Steroidobacteraceae bacterium]|nr:MFS transporter [Steroidobacteraceae bacterium]
MTASTEAPAPAAIASPQSHVIDVSQIIDTQKLNAFVVRLVVISWLVTFCDGFDLNSIAFVAPYLKTAYALDNRTVANIFASGGAGALFGGLLFGWMGDRIGRRAAIITAVGLSGTFTLLLALADRPWELVFIRFINGVALGGALPLIWTLTIEYVPTRYRATVVTLVMLGYGLGVFVAGPLSLALIPGFGWQSVFVCGGVASLLAALLVWRKLPESLRYLAHRGGDPERIARIIRRLIPGRRIEPAQVFVPALDAPRLRAGVALFDGPLRWITPLLWIAFAASSMTMYFFVSWGPILFERMGLTRSDAAWSSSFNALTGAVGAVAVMRFTDRRGPGSLMVMPVIALPLLLVLGTTHVSASGIMLMTGVLYLLLGGTHYGIQSILGIYYPTAERARGAGWASSIGKVGSVAAQLMGGWLLGSQMSSRSPFLVLAVFPALFAVAILSLAAVARRSGLRAQP